MKLRILKTTFIEDGRICAICKTLQLAQQSPGPDGVIDTWTDVPIINEVMTIEELLAQEKLSGYNADIPTGGS